MNPEKIERFFFYLQEKMDRRLTVILTGAAAGALMGYARPSLDVDFGVKLTPAQAKDAAFWEQLRRAVDAVSKKTGIAGNFAADLDRWSSITFLDYEKHAAPYKKIGKLDLRLMACEYWAIGKLARYLRSDLEDLTRVLKAQKPDAAACARLWGKALKQSPPSSACFLYRKNAENFLAQWGRRVWGKTFDAAAAIKAFHRAAGIQD